MQPLLICGHQRSGTTLLASLLDGHQELLVFPYETTLFNRGGSRRFDNHRAADIVEDVLREGEAWLRWDRNDDLKGVVRSALKENSPVGTLGSLMELIVKSYAYVEQKQEVSYWAEKTPLNEMWLPIFKKEYPNMRALYIVRDPRDVYLSWRRKRENEGRGSKSMPIDKFVVSWSNSVNTWLYYMRHAGTGLMLRYEDLVCNTNQCMSKVSDFLQVPFSSELLRPTKEGESWQGNSSHTGRRSGISDDSVGRWRNELSVRELRFIERYCGPGMRRLGYIVEEVSLIDMVKVLRSKKLPLNSHFFLSAISLRSSRLADWYIGRQMCMRARRYRI